MSLNLNQTSMPHKNASTKFKVDLYTFKNNKKERLKTKNKKSRIASNLTTKTFLFLNIFF